MLKIKDNVDLKELEKFGFKPTAKNECFGWRWSLPFCAKEVYGRKYTLPFKKERVKLDFDIDLDLPTHRQLIVNF